MATKAQIKRDIDELFKNDFIQRGADQRASTFVDAIERHVASLLGAYGLDDLPVAQIAVLLKMIAGSIMNETNDVPNPLRDRMRAAAEADYARTLQQLNDHLENG